MSIEEISPKDADTLIKEGAILIDIRSPREYNSEHINSSINISFKQLQNTPLTIDNKKTVIFYCLFGTRTSMNKKLLSNASTTVNKAYILKGGINNWKKEKLPIERGVRQPMEVFRQIQITTGSLIILGSLLGYFVSQWFYLLPGLIGLGLLFAGVTGCCALAVLLMKMPWNNPKN